MTRTISAIFRDHPASVGESYFEHMAFALSFSVRLLGAGAAALIHAFIPCLFEKTASGMIKDMHARIEGR